MRFTSRLALVLALCSACGGSSAATGSNAPATVTDVSLEAKRPDGQAPTESDPDEARRAELEQATNAGVLGALSEDQQSAFAALLGSSDQDGVGGLQGATAGEGFGVGGLGSRGVGAGSGGTGEGTGGLGGLGAIGTSGGGSGGAAGTGAGFSGYGSRPPSPPPTQVRLGAPTVQGALDPELVRRILQRHVPQLRYCYAKEQARSPQLAGALDVSFSIGADGAVTSASVSSSTLQSTAVEGCVVERLRNMLFSSPERGFVRVDVSMEFKTPPPPPPQPQPSAPPAPSGAGP